MKDLVIIGAGPAGLLAAAEAAGRGLCVSVIERKKEITEINRTCSAQFVLDDGYENEKLLVEDDRLVFTRNGFEVPYTGRRVPITGVNWFAPDGGKVVFRHSDNRASAMKFDKSELLRGLVHMCEENGVEILSGTTAVGGADSDDCVRVDVVSSGKRASITAKKLIIAEGANAALTEKFGMNADRAFFGAPLVVSYKMAGVTGVEPQTWNQYYGNEYHPFAEVMIGPAVEGGDCVELTVMGTSKLKPDALIKNVIESSPISECFKGAEITEKTGCCVKSYAPLSTPSKGNVLVIGDSAAHVEVIVQGALMCGHHAAEAVERELEGEDGFSEYAKWWRGAFEFNQANGAAFAKFYATLGLKQRFTDEEICRLFAFLRGQQLSGEFSQFEVPKTFWRALLCHSDEIKAKDPDIYEKILPIAEYQRQGLL